MAIPFIHDFDFEYGVVQTVSPLIRRLVARNPGPFTYAGTGVYIIGHGTVAVIDPGPALPDHYDALRQALDGETVSHILVTHGHLDHSPLARPLAQHTGAQVYASPLTPLPLDAASGEEEEDRDFRADVPLADGDVLSGPGWTLRTVATPGHMRGHLCFALDEENALFSGDHIMGWSTTVIAPPEGDMADYMHSLERILTEGYTTLWPTHGPPIRDVAPFVRAYLDHRLQREAGVLAAVRQQPHRAATLVPGLYPNLDPRLHPAAALSVQAHLNKLLAEGRVQFDGVSYRGV